MDTTFTHRLWRAGIAVSLVVGTAACGQTAQQGTDAAAAAEPTAAWTTAFNAGETAALAALYSENARSLPPGGAPVVGRSNIESYWRSDIGEGGPTTTLTPVDTVAQGDLLHVEGTYQVNDKGGAELARGQYQQLWSRAGNQWQIQREMWRIDPALHRETQVAERLTTSWTSAYNAGDAKTLGALYADDAAVSTVQEGTISGRSAIEAFWKGDFGATKPSSMLTLTDVYLAGELAHLEGDYKVSDSGKITEGRYIQLWMRDANGWRIHREMWWR
jgi:ketosteroid isomerase-like protein